MRKKPKHSNYLRAMREEKPHILIIYVLWGEKKPHTLIIYMQWVAVN